MLNITQTGAADPRKEIIPRGIGEFIIDIVLAGRTGTEGKFDQRLWQVMAEYQRVLDARLEGIEETTDSAERVSVHYLMCHLLAGEHIKAHDIKRANREPWTVRDRKVSRYLNAALDELSAATPTLTPDLLDRLPERLYFNFYEVTREEAERYAEEIKAIVGQAVGCLLTD